MQAEMNMVGNDAVKAGINRDVVIKVILTLAIIVLIIARRPELLIQPRFWAEEGSVFFASAHANSFLANLFSVHFGYYTLYNSLATSFAALFPLEIAPLVTTWLALIVQTMVSVMVIWGRYRMIPSLGQKFVVAVAIQLLAYTGIWLNTLGVQYFFCLLSFLILMYDEKIRTQRVTILHGGMLLFSGLTGVLSCFMIPMFAYKFLQTKARHLAVYAGILATSFALQLAVFIMALQRQDPEVSFRLVDNSLVKLLLKTVSFQFASPFFGHLILTRPAMEDVGFEVRKLIFAMTGFDGFRSESQVITSLAGFFVLALLIILFVKQWLDLEVRYIAGLLVVIVPLSTLLSIQMSGGPRYTFAPSVMLIFFLVSFFSGAYRGSWQKKLALVLVTCSLLSSSYEYRRSINETAYNSNWLPWKDEVRKWRQYPVYDPAIWPPPWRMQLKK